MLGDFVRSRKSLFPEILASPKTRLISGLKQLVAEQLVTVTTHRGFQKLEWQKLRERNEVLDCRVYAHAAAWIAGADRWSGANPNSLRPRFEVAEQRGLFWNG
jgi:phage terminase large subunit GpA-like protein